MKKFKIVVTVAVILGSICVLPSCNAQKTGNVTIKTEVDTLSYALGSDFGSNILRQLSQMPCDYDKDMFVAGFMDGFYEKDLKISQEDAYAFLNTFFEKLQAEQTAKAATEAEGRVESNAKYLAENKAKEGVITTASGLQYRIITEGKGKTPTADDKVKVHYVGRLTDGTVFDSSIERGEPIEFPVTGVIQGWVEALQMMPVGSKWELTIPPELGYGDRDMGTIKPNSVLVFEVELLGIN
ncbi:MAG: FKBP-type peptidyl-prolyl cis-trans isomerase [Bacteroidales bacterium]|jgi:FKBP-type peptidyl-prolyl cis-trans isomerase FkpA|nr:FKBP-type peptidyl-prolyl cis-trans isomerase [Bacteroidales bacterium]MDD2204231.1 FKBP-type peptidyl-prolyl cis-trans isomerase [Bacteroidales bacterium]MDD3152980.1 FKBP-type peptidyl-prolyl cis-trans isomerase [Bacteroidales bacterium]MDD3913596.1 FKBP-type peptidyl-prolyl cis-trans isomerase [Bacteroidales bacterium]MDD4633636.1 FKBP-type peptidyl-prolyl cis-trans isomerase [Bacteroidales bacterium]